MISVFAALAGPELEPEPFDPVQACVDAAGPVIEASPLDPSERIALVVGVPCHRDPSTPSLRFSSRDASRVAEALQDRGYQVQRLSTLVDRDAFLAVIDDIAAVLPRDGELVIYFSGHGVLRESQRGLQRYLVFSDTGLSDVESTGLAVDALDARLADLPAAHRLVVQDTCFAATTESGGKGLGGVPGAKALSLPAPALQPADTRLYASRFYEVATEDPTREGSVYTTAWLEALEGESDLDGDGCVGFFEAHLEATRLTRAARQGYQNPEWAGTPSNPTADCPRPPTRAVRILGDHATSSAPTAKHPAGTWSGPSPRRRPQALIALLPQLRASSTRPSLALGLDALAAIPIGRLDALVGTRIAAAGGLGETCMTGVEVTGRAGLLTPIGPVSAGAVVDFGAVRRRPGCDLPRQTGLLTGVHARAQLSRGKLFGLLELGAAAVPVRRERLALPLEPDVAIGVGVHL